MENTPSIDELLTDDAPIIINGEEIDKEEIAPIERPKLGRGSSNKWGKVKTPSIKSTKMKKKSTRKYRRIENLLLDDDSPKKEEKEDIRSFIKKKEDYRTAYIQKELQEKDILDPTFLRNNDVVMLEAVKPLDTKNFFSAYEDVNEDQEFILRQGFMDRIKYIKDMNLLEIEEKDLSKFSLVQLHAYASSIQKNLILKQISIRTRKIITYICFFLELIFGFFGINIEGYTELQADMYNIYHSFFIDMGEDYISQYGMKSTVSPWVKIGLYNAGFLGIYLLASYLCPSKKYFARNIIKKITDNIMDENTESSNESVGGGILTDLAKMFFQRGEKQEEPMKKYEN